MIVSANTVVYAAEYMTEEQIDIVTSGLDDNVYVLPTPEGGFITKSDGSNTFDAYQIATYGTQPMTVSQFKEYLRTFDISPNQQYNNNTAFRAAYPPFEKRVLKLYESYWSNPFSQSGWRYGELKFYPAKGTGDYLLWEAILDTGIVEDGVGVSIALSQATPTYVYSRNGTYFKTYNPAKGSRYIVRNPE